MVYKYNKIMIIDDNDIDIYILNILIKNNNLAKYIIDFDNGLKAIEYLENHKNDPEKLPDIIFLDLYMPLADGFQFLESFEKINTKHIHKCKIFMVTSSISENDIRMTKANKSVEKFISKPISLEFLNSL